MGCIPNRTHIPIKSRQIQITHKVYQTSSRVNKSFNKISYSNVVNIVDFLNFKDLYELGKTNKLFNNMVKQHRILIKFFKKKTPSTILQTQNSNSSNGTKNLERIQSFSTPMNKQKSTED